MEYVAIFAIGVVFIVGLFVLVRLRARTHEGANPLTEEPHRAPPER